MVQDRAILTKAHQ